MLSRSLEPVDLFQDGGGRLAWEEGNDSDSTLGLFDSLALEGVEGVNRIVAAFDVDVRLGRLEKARRCHFGKDAYRADGFEGSQDGSAVGFRIDRAPWPFELKDGLVPVQPD